VYSDLETKTGISGKVQFGFATVNINVKQSPYRPGVAQRVPGI